MIERETVIKKREVAQNREEASVISLERKSKQQAPNTHHISANTNKCPKTTV